MAVYNFMTQTRDEHGAVRVKAVSRSLYQPELERVCIARTDVTDIIRQEQQQKEALAALTAAEQANAAKTDFPVPDEPRDPHAHECHYRNERHRRPGCRQ